MGICVGKQMALERRLAKIVQKRDKQMLSDLSDDDINVSHEFLVELATLEWKEGLIIFQKRYKRWDIPIRHLLTDWYCVKSPQIIDLLFNYCPTEQRTSVVETIYDTYTNINPDYIDRTHAIKHFIALHTEYLTPLHKQQFDGGFIANQAKVSPRRYVSSLSPPSRPLGGVKPIAKVRSEPLDILEPRIQPIQSPHCVGEEEDSDCPAFLQFDGTKR